MGGTVITNSLPVSDSTLSHWRSGCAVAFFLRKATTKYRDSLVKDAWRGFVGKLLK
jgi:hypothetical protein